MAAVSALLTYLQDNLYIYYANRSIKLDYQASEGYAIIGTALTLLNQLLILTMDFVVLDIATADRLELVCSNQPAQANRYSSLFGIMNRCLTRVGTRNLRSIILQPLYSSKKINERLNCVEELIKHPEILLSVQVRYRARSLVWFCFISFILGCTAEIIQRGPTSIIGYLSS